MLRTSFILIAKRQLTHDVFELTYSCENLSSEPPLEGQYVMFQLAPWLNRAYSLASFSLSCMQSPQTPTLSDSQLPTFTLLVKRIADGRGSPLICDADIGSTLSGMIPLGHFTLQDTPRSKCFIGTGTGFAPLYCQLLECSNLGIRGSSIAFVFWVRTFADSFYEDEIVALGARFQDFEYVQYFSREDAETRPWSIHHRYSTMNGYVTDWINADNIEAYEEFYICGSPAMVKDARAKLESLGVKKENIYWEQF